MNQRTNEVTREEDKWRERIGAFGCSFVHSFVRKYKRRMTAQISMCILNVQLTIEKYVRKLYRVLASRNIYDVIIKGKISQYAYDRSSLKNSVWERIGSYLGSFY